MITLIRSILVTGSFLGLVTTASASQFNTLELLVQKSLVIMPSSALKGLMGVVAPEESRVFSLKLKKLHSQCQILVERDRWQEKLNAMKTKKAVKSLHRQTPKKYSRNRNVNIKLVQSTQTKLISAKEMATYKNDFNNAVSRANNIREHLESTDQEISRFLDSWNPAEQSALNFLDSQGSDQYQVVKAIRYRFTGSYLGEGENFKTLLSNLQHLLSSRLIPDIKNLSSSVKTGNFKNCQTITGGYIDV